MLLRCVVTWFGNNEPISDEVAYTEWKYLVSTGRLLLRPKVTSATKAEEVIDETKEETEGGTITTKTTRTVVTIFQSATPKANKTQGDNIARPKMRKDNSFVKESRYLVRFTGTKLNLQHVIICALVRITTSYYLHYRI